MKTFILSLSLILLPLIFVDYSSPLALRVASWFCVIFGWSVFFYRIHTAFHTIKKKLSTTIKHRKQSICIKTKKAKSTRTRRDILHSYPVDTAPEYYPNKEI